MRRIGSNHRPNPPENAGIPATTLPAVSSTYTLDGDIAIITLDRPDQFNAIDHDLSVGVIGGLERAGQEARAAVLTGAGNAFCAGADLNMIGEDTDLGDLLDNVFHPLLGAIVGAAVPVIGAINGVAAGAGLGMALATDIRVMAESAFLTSAFTAIGLAPDSGTTWWLPHSVGVSRALELAMTNRRVPASECAELGLCAKVVPNHDVLDEAVALARALADLVPDSLVTTRKLIRDAAGTSFESALAAEREEQSRLGKTPQHKEGVAAFLEKRPADYRNT